MKHIYLKGTSDRTLVLFHGTGGTEEDLVSVGKIMDPDAHILSLRGEIREEGMNRFFKRLAEGVFDEEDLKLQAKRITVELHHLVGQYGLDKDQLVGIGYSNGANIIAGILYRYGGFFRMSVLFHPMVPLQGGPEKSLQGSSVFIGAGINDPIVPLENTRRLQTELAGQGAEVNMKTYEMGHRLTLTEVEEAKAWLLL